MAKSVLSVMRGVAFSYVYIQTIVVAAIAALLYLFDGRLDAFSFMWGGLICIIPNIYFAHKLFARTGAQAAKKIIAALYISEVVKFVITFLLFFIAFKYFNTNKIAIFMGYIVAQVTFWLTALFRHQTVNRL